MPLLREAVEPAMRVAVDKLLRMFASMLNRAMLIE